ncbi:hypothetical protein [Photorhabdus asymbiotica]|nr:hypothetical protein [Photorhabdus asymbiotica]
MTGIYLIDNDVTEVSESSQQSSNVKDAGYKRILAVILCSKP